jgi:hypothetical protein
MGAGVHGARREAESRRAVLPDVPDRRAHLQALAIEWSDVDFKARKVRIAATNKGDDDRFAHMPTS